MIGSFLKPPINVVDQALSELMSLNPPRPKSDFGHAIDKWIEFYKDQGLLFKKAKPEHITLDHLNDLIEGSYGALVELPQILEGERVIMDPTKW